MPVTIKARCRYDGTDFAGWQVQPGQRTVQDELEQALSRIVGQQVRIAGSGRTDAGVHALGQYFSAKLPDEAPVEDLARALSKMLGPEIRVETVERVSDDFHASYSSIGKRYRYAFYSGPLPDPFGARYAWCLPWELDRGLLRASLDALTGEHDFAGFCSSGSSAKTTVRTIYSIQEREGPVVGPADAPAYWHLEFHGSGFLYKMVRNLTGTVIDIARGQTRPERLRELLEAPAPYHGFTAPAHGLFLAAVDY